MTSDAQEETSTDTGVDFRDGDKLDATSGQGRPESSQTTTLTGAKTDSPFFIRDLSFTHEEEKRIIRIIDTRLFPMILWSTFVLNMDRTNHSNAISDNLPADLGFTIDTVNTGTIIYAIFFTVATFSGAMIAKRVGPANWIPILMFAWGLVTGAHAPIKDRAGYWTVRAWIAITEGGVIPSTLIYLGGFYKSTELATRLAWFWGVQNIASAVSGLMAAGLLQLRGVRSLEGWKWYRVSNTLHFVPYPVSRLFIIDCIITLVAAVVLWFYLPRNIVKTKGGIRGFKPWFDERQTQIAVTRLIRDDPAKRYYESVVTWTDVKDSVTDVGLWGHLIITAIQFTPTNPLSTYLPTVIKSFSFNVFVSNALTAPPYVLHCISSVVVIWHSDRVRERGYHACFASCWLLVGWILLRCLPTTSSRGVRYFGALVAQSWPYIHPLNIAWMSENMGSIGKRTVASGAIIGAANIYATWASQIYQAKDAPTFRTGNTINIIISGTAAIGWILLKFYYKRRNSSNAEKLRNMTGLERKEQGLRDVEAGNAALTFVFTN